MKRQLMAFITALAILATVFGGAFGAVEITLVKSYDVGAQLWTWTATLDSVANDTSATFSLSNYDHVNWTNFPFSYFIQASTTGDSVNVTTYIEGSFEGTTWTAVDTIAAITSETAATGTIDFNNVKRPLYRMRQVDLAKLEEDTTTTVTTKFWIYQDK